MAIIQKTSGMRSSDFADKFLFKPIGITNYFWQSDPQGINIGAGWLAMTTMEMARFGYLYLKKGNWNGNQIIPADWAEASISSQIDSTNIRSPLFKNKGYGFLFWRLPFGGFTSAGQGGQFIMVIPERDIVVVFTAGLTLKDGYIIPLKLTEIFINKSVISGSAIAENKKKQDELESSVRKLGQPENYTINYIPKTAEVISGKKYIMDSNPENLKSVVLSFSVSNECILKTEYLSNIYKTIAGLDGKYYENRIGDTFFQEFLRGRWIGENTFIIEYYTPWYYERKIQNTFQFDQCILKMKTEIVGEWNNKIFLLFPSDEKQLELYTDLL